MDAYERFCYITRKVLDRALKEAEPYAVDERIFQALAGAEGDDLEAHLEELEATLLDDEQLTDLERAFLGAVVANALRGHGGEPCCYQELLPLARRPGEDTSSSMEG